MWYCRNASCPENGIGKEGYSPEILGEMVMSCGTCGEACTFGEAEPPAGQTKPAEEI